MFLDAILLDLNTAVIALEKGNLNCFLKEGNIYTNTHRNRECTYKRSVSILSQNILDHTHSIPGRNGSRILIFHSKATVFLKYTYNPYLNIAVYFISTEYAFSVCSNKASPIGTVFCFAFYYKLLYWTLVCLFAFVPESKQALVLKLYKEQQ